MAKGKKKVKKENDVEYLLIMNVRPIQWLKTTAFMYRIHKLCNPTRQQNCPSSFGKRQYNKSQYFPSKEKKNV